MANNRLCATLAAAALVGVLSVSAAAEVASSDSAAESVPADSAALQPQATAPPALSDQALDKDIRYSPDEIAEILLDHPNAFTAAADPDDQADHAASSAADQAAGSQIGSVTAATSTGTIWDKPFNEYSPEEGYLLLLFLLAISMAAIKLIKYLWL